MINREDEKLKPAFLAAFNIIKEKRNWTTHRAARDSESKAVNASDDSAVQWCSLGIISKEFSDDMHMHDLGTDLIEQFYRKTLIEYIQ
jgi:hypothetical protein